MKQTDGQVQRMINGATEAVNRAALALTSVLTAEFPERVSTFNAADKSASKWYNTGEERVSIYRGKRSYLERRCIGTRWHVSNSINAF